MGAQVRHNLGKRAAALSRTALAAENTAHRKFYYIWFCLSWGNCSGRAAMLIVASEARDRGQFAKSTPEMKAWFESLKSGKGFLCCSDADGTAVSDVDWESKDGHYRVRLGGQWIDVPDDALVTVPNRVGRTMVWPMPMIEGDTIKIRCFMAGSMI